MEVIDRQPTSPSRPVADLTRDWGEWACVSLYLDRCQVDTPAALVKATWEHVRSLRESGGKVVDFGAGDGRFARDGRYDEYVGYEIDADRCAGSRFGKQFPEPEDRVRQLLRSVRTPCAQMDVFAVVLQICADHLIHAGSPREVDDAFTKMRTSCDFFIGAAHRMPYLNLPPATTCYRSTHWYAGAP